MKVLDHIIEQAHDAGWPLFAVSLTALARADTPALLNLHWHAFGRDETAPADTALRAVPVSSLQLNIRWLQLADLERDILDAAWQLGAWSLERRERRGCNTVGAGADEALACRQAFADPGLFPAGQAPASEAPDRATLMAVAARLGYVHWQFRPVREGIWPAADGDDTLSPGGGRTPPCPVAPQPARGPGGVALHYRLGRIDRLWTR